MTILFPNMTERQYILKKMVQHVCYGSYFNRKVQPKHVSAVKFVTVVTYTAVIFPIVCVARYVA
jgi:hypothetical protein